MSEKLGNMLVDFKIPQNSHINMPNFEMPETESVEFNGSSLTQEYMLHEVQHATGIPIADAKLTIELMGSIFSGIIAKPVPIFNVNPNSQFKPRYMFEPSDNLQDSFINPTNNKIIRCANDTRYKPSS